MKLIGKGYWYNVFDLGNGRVIKLEKNLIQKAYGSGLFEGFKPAVFNQLTKGRKGIEANYKRLETQIDLLLIGNPRFLDGINYEQDKVEVLRDVLNYSTKEESKRIIDKYIECILECWRNGFSELIHNFTINNGMDSSGRVILLDFNEITFSRDEALSVICSKRWVKSWSLKGFDPNLKDYYLRQMDNKITINSLEINWLRG